MKEWALRGEGSSTAYDLTAFVVKTLIPNASAEERREGLIAERLKATGWEVDSKQIGNWWSQAKNVYHDTDTFKQVKWAIFSNAILSNAFARRHLLYSPSFWDDFAIAPIYKDAKVRAQQAKKVRDAIRKEYQWSVEVHDDFYPAGQLMIQAIKYGY